MAEYSTTTDEIKKLAEGDLPSVVAKLKDYLDQQDQVELNIAVTGMSGAGKSKFINAFRGMGDEEEGSAATGVVETTMVSTGYSHPNYPNVKLWDLPGIGTPNFKAADYLKRVEFKRFDFFIIITSDRFRECDADLAKQIIKMNKKFYFVRSKIDRNIYDEKHKKNFNEEELINQIRKDCIKGLESAGVNSPDIFLISSRELALYDFNDLQQKMEKELPQHKRQVLMLTLPNITLEINKKKKVALESRIWKVALLSAGVATVPIPGLSLSVDLSILVMEIKQYYNAFGLDPDTLKRVSEKSGKSVEELRVVMKSPLSNVKAVVDSEIKKVLLTVSSSLLLEETAEFWVKLIPAVGLLAAGTMSFSTIYVTLKHFLDHLAEDAENVLRIALQSSV